MIESAFLACVGVALFLLVVLGGIWLVVAIRHNLDVIAITAGVGVFLLVIYVVTDKGEPPVVVVAPATPVSILKETEQRENVEKIKHWLSKHPVGVTPEDVDRLLKTPSKKVKILPTDVVESG